MENNKPYFIEFQLFEMDKTILVNINLVEAIGNNRVKTGGVWNRVKGTKFELLEKVMNDKPITEVPTKPKQKQDGN